jgi:hypothetical protein
LARSLAWHPIRREGHPRHGRDHHRMGCRAIRKQGPRNRRRGDPPTDRRGRGPNRKDQRGGPGVWRHLVWRPDPQSLEHRGRISGVECRFGSGHSCRPGRVRARNGDVGLDRCSLRSMRNCGLAPDLWPCVPCRGNVSLLVPRQTQCEVWVRP